MPDDRSGIDPMDDDTMARPVRAVLPAGALGLWLREGARGAFLRAPRLDALEAAPASPALVLALVLLANLLATLWERLAIAGAAEFQWRSLGDGWWLTAVSLWLCWWVARSGACEGSARRPGVAGLFGLLVAQGVLITAASALVLVPLARMSAAPPPWAAWALWGGWWGTLAWMVLAELRLLWRFAAGGRRMRVGIVAVVLLGAAASVFAPPMPLWTPRLAGPEGPEASRLLRLTPELIARQQQAADAGLAGLAPQRPGQVDLYALTFAPDGSEDVFRRESRMVAGVLAERFDARGRVLELVNHPRTAAELGWATPGNMQRAIARIASVMDRDEDVLLIHLTSHGARDGRLAASLWPLEMNSLTPAELRRWLDEAGIRNRVVSISACYAGSWIEPLAGDTTLVMTAADADHTSYGCGSKSELTFFGRAVFDEQLRATRSFEQAHAAAREVIAQREREAGKTDGYSNPQIRVGAAIREPLRRLAAQLDGSGR